MKRKTARLICDAVVAPILGRFAMALVPFLALALAGPGSARAQATWDGGGADGSWATATNWVGDAVPTFGNTLDLTFYASGAGNLSTYLGPDRTIRSLTFNDDADSNVNISFTANGSTGARTLTMGNATDGATITVAAGSAGSHNIGSGANGGTIALGGDLAIDHNGSGTLTTRGITGAYGVTKDGAGTWTQRGGRSNDFTGGLVVNAGTNNLDGINTFGGGLTVNGGVVNISATSVAAWTGGLTATGGLTTFSVPGTYAGDTSITGGRVRVNTNYALGSGTLTLGQGAVLSTPNARTTLTNDVVITGNVQLGEALSRLTLSGDIDLGSATRTITAENQADNGNLATVLDGVVSGSGGIIKAGAGVFQLNGTANDFTGDVTVNEGMLQLRGQGSMGNATKKLIINGGKLSTVGAQSLTLANPIEIGGDFALSSGSGTLTLNGTMDLGGATRTLTAEGNGNKSIAGDISNGGLVVNQSNGTLTFSGNNTYTGTTTLSNGTLLVNGAHTGGGLYTVASGATLGGTGLIDAAIAALAGGIVAPGNSIGTLTTSNSFDLDGTLLIELDNGAGPGGLSDLLDVNGLFDLTNGVVQFVFTGTMTNDYYIFAEYDTLSGGGFLNALNTPEGYGIDYTFGVGGNQIALVIPEPSTFALLGLGAVAMLGLMRRGRRGKIAG